jgi:hypothetical protein
LGSYLYANMGQTGLLLLGPQSTIRSHQFFTLSRNYPPPQTYGTQLFISLTTNCLLEIYFNFTYTCTLRFPNLALPKKSPCIKTVQMFFVSPFETYFFTTVLYISLFQNHIYHEGCTVQSIQIFTHFCFFDKTISNNCTENELRKLQCRNYPGLTSHRKKNILFCHVI